MAEGFYTPIDLSGTGYLQFDLWQCEGCNQSFMVCLNEQRRLVVWHPLTRCATIEGRELETPYPKKWRRRVVPFTAVGLNPGESAVLTLECPEDLFAPFRVSAPRQIEFSAEHLRQRKYLKGETLELPVVNLSEQTCTARAALFAFVAED